MIKVAADAAGVQKQLLVLFVGCLMSAKWLNADLCHDHASLCHVLSATHAGTNGNTSRFLCSGRICLPIGI